jgi:hypothetical protein
MESNNASVKPYVKPAVKVLGSFAELTKGGRSGNNLDATFPSGTPFSQLTFS